MPRRRRRERLRALAEEVARRYPELEDARRTIVDGNVVVDGIVRTNPATLVRVGASIRLREAEPLRGATKLRAGLAAFALDVRGRVALDVGAAAGGFTAALVEAGAARVYAVDAGHGQLRGFLRQDARVVNLEATNLADLNASLVPDAVDVVALDLSYLALSDAVPQLERVELRPDADAIALVKPQFELRRSRAPTAPAELERAVARAREGFGASQWRVQRVIESPVRGAGGSIEFLLHATRAG